MRIARLARWAQEEWLGGSPEQGSREAQFSDASRDPLSTATALACLPPADHRRLGEQMSQPYCGPVKDANPFDNFSNLIHSRAVPAGRQGFRGAFSPSADAGNQSSQHVRRWRRARGQCEARAAVGDVQPTLAGCSRRAPARRSCTDPASNDMSTQ